MMDVILGRNRVDAPEAWVLQPPGKHHVTVEPAGSRRHLSEGHPDLKGDPGLFRQDGHGSAGVDRLPDGLVEGPYRGILAPEMVGEVVAAAGVGLVAVGEAAAASRTGPEWGPVWYDHGRAYAAPFMTWIASASRSGSSVPSRSRRPSWSSS